MKKCEYCNTENNEQVIACVKCGLPLPGAPTQEEIKQKEPDLVTEPVKKKKKLLLPILLGSVAVVVAAAIAFLFILPTNSKFMFPDTSLLVERDFSKNESVLVVDAEKTEKTFAASFPYDGESSLDGKVQIMLDADKNSYVVTKDGFSFLGKSDVFSLATSGKGVVYQDEEGKLYYQTIPMQGEAVFLCERTNGAVISPDGRTVAYSKDGETTDTLYVYHQGEHIKIGDECYPMAISNNAQYIYYSHITRSGGIGFEGFYLTDLSGKETVLEKDSWGIRDYIFNKDHTQVIFMTAEACFVVDHGKKIKIAGLKDLMTTSQDLNMIVPKEASSRQGESGYDNYVIYGVETLAKNYYVINYGYTICYIDANWEVHEVTNNVSALTNKSLSRDGSVFCYAEEGTLFRIKNANINGKKQIAENVTSYITTSNGRAVYYLDDKNTLWYQKGTGSAIELANSVSQMDITHDDYLLFLCKNDDNFLNPEERSTLYAVKNGEKPQLISADVYRVDTSSTATYYYAIPENSDYDYDIYGAKKGIDFQFIAKGG